MIKVTAKEPHTTSKESVKGVKDFDPFRCLLNLIWSHIDSYNCIYLVICNFSGKRIPQLDENREVSECWRFNAMSATRAIFMAKTVVED